MEVTPTAANVGEYIQIVKDKSLLRRVAEAAADLTGMIQEGTGTAQEVLDAAEQRIYAIRQGRAAQGLTPISTVVLSVLDRLEELSQNSAAVPGLSTGLPDLDAAISGLNDSDLILLAARPGMGKTSMALNILLHAGKFSGKTAVFFSLEMSREQLAMRLISNEAFVDNQKLVTGKLSDDDWDKIALAAASLGKTHILIDDNPALSVADMNAKCRRVENLGLVIIDYLQLMQSAGGKNRYAGENRQQAVSDISRAMKIMAKELNVPVLCLSQLSRAPEGRSDKRPMLSDLRESGAIEQDADIVMFLYRDDYYNEDSENRNIAECIVAKNRHGETRKIELQWLPAYTTFSSLDRTHEES
jgi:replicative DNA helicase